MTRICKRPGCGKPCDSWYCSRECRQENAPWMQPKHRKVTPAPGTNPVRCALILLDTAEVSRRVDCEHYGKCLDVALGEGWPSFSCGGCSGYVARDRDDMRRDLEGLAIVLREVCGESGARLYDRTFYGMARKRGY